MRIGLYGGTFDPPHIGHLRMVIALVEAHQIDLVYFCVAATSPFKMGQSQTAAHHRLEMVRRAISPISNFRACDLELQRPAPSYTIDTLEQLQRNHPADQLFLMIGDDMMLDFPKWHRAEDLASRVPILVGRRSDKSRFPRGGSAQLRAALRRGSTNTPLVEVSGTEIRARMQQGLYCGHLLSAPVLDYIAEQGLYI
jgi:nicotinate-nucleotide adenylyltransferase